MTTFTGVRGLGRTTGGGGLAGGVWAAGEGLAIVMLSVVLALTGVGALGDGVRISGTVRWIWGRAAGEGFVADAGAAGGDTGFTGWTVEGAEVAGGAAAFLKAAGFIAGRVMVDVTTDGAGAAADESVFTTTVPLDFWGAVEKTLNLKNEDA